MARKKKKGSRNFQDLSQMSGLGNPGKKDDFTHNPFASALKVRDKKKSANLEEQLIQAHQEAQRREKVLQEAAAQERAVIAEERFRKSGDVAMTEQEMFEAALEDLSPVQIDRGKYGGAGPMTGHVQITEPKANEEPQDEYSRSDAAFEMEFEDMVVEKMEHNLYIHEPSDVDVDKLYRFKQKDYSSGAALSRADQLEALMQGNPSLSKEQVKLLEDGRRAQRERTLQEISIRKFNQVEAQQRLDRARVHAAEHKLRYLRVITGKGLGSASEPVLKRFLVEWCNALECIWAPEILSDGTFGSFIVRLPRPEKPQEA